MRGLGAKPSSDRCFLAFTVFSGALGTFINRVKAWFQIANSNRNMLMRGGLVATAGASTRVGGFRKAIDQRGGIEAR